MQDRRKRGGALVSKHRFIAAQMEAYLADDLWLKLARHANAMADALAARTDGGRLQAGVAGRGERGVRAAAARRRPAAQGRGRDLLSVDSASLPKVIGRGRAILVRLVTSFQTTADDVDRFLAIVRGMIARMSRLDATRPSSA